MTTSSKITIGILAGVLGLLLVHQPAVYVLGQLGLGRGGEIYSMAAVAPFGVPRIVSLSFWCALWGIAFTFLLFPRLGRGPLFFLWAALAGGLLVAAVSWFIVSPIRGQPIAAGGDVTRLAIGWLINGMFALGAAIVYGIATRGREAGEFARG